MENLYIGTSKNGIYHFEFSNGIFKQVNSNTTFDNCSYLCKNSNTIYHIVESSNHILYPYGCVVSLDKKTFNIINCQQPYGKGPCFVTLDDYNKIIYIANYGDGSLSAFQLNNDGSIGKLLKNISYGSPSRIHATVLSNAKNLLFVTDLGRNKILMYKIIFTNNTLDLYKIDEYSFSELCQPRHITIIDDIIYLINEFSCDIYSFKLINDKLHLIDVTSILPNNINKKPNFTGCTIKISNDNRFLYTPVRGHDSISVFEIASNKLKLIQNIPCNGNNPRDINFNADETFLLVANLDSNNISAFKRNINTGLLEFNNSFNISSPSCII